MITDSFVFALSTQEIEEEGDYSCIDQIGEHGAYDWNYEERLDGVVVFIAYSTHIGHCIGCCAKAEATHTGTQNGSVIVASQ